LYLVEIEKYFLYVLKKHSLFIIEMSAFFVFMLDKIVSRNSNKEITMLMNSGILN